MHVYAGYPLYLPENMDRWHSYPPPAPGGYYVVPWLWFDGNQHGGTAPALWENLITTRMALPACADISLSGYYAPASMTGMIYARLRNDSTAAIPGSVLFVITEDSLFFPAPNFDSIHNHVTRDFLPDHIGTYAEIPANDSIVVSQAFALQAGWDPQHCNITVWLQDTVRQADSTKNIYQAAIIPIAGLGIEENTTRTAATPDLVISPNPSNGSVRITSGLFMGSEYSLSLYDCLGRSAIKLSACVISDGTTIELDLSRTGIEPGVYFLVLKSGSRSRSEKVVVQ